MHRYTPIISLRAVLPSLLVLACSPVQSTSSVPPATFAGISGLTVNTDQSLQLTWQAPSSVVDQITYRIYRIDLDALPDGGDLTSKIGNRSVTLHKNVTSTQPASSSNAIAEVAQSVYSYTVPQLPDTSKNYAFQVKAVNKGNGKVDDNSTVLVVQGFGDTTFKGCTSGKGVAYNAIEIDFKVPAMASSIAVLRDGQQVFTSTDPTVTSFKDTGVAPGHSYQYTCQIELGPTTMRGTEPLVLSPLDPFATYKGCMSATASGADRIILAYDQLPPAEKINIYRNGALAAFYPISATDAAKGEITASMTDSGLSEGTSYTYTCSAVIGAYEKIGTNKATVATLASNPPVFAGISQITVLSPHSVSVSWGVTSGVPAAVFQVYATPGAAIDYTAPAAVVPVNMLTTTLTNLGDELPYAFAVRACTANNICDTNTVVLNVPGTSGVMPDAGPPATPGLGSVTKAAGQITVSAPWTAANGLVLFRRVKFYCDSSLTASTDPSAYINSQDFPVPNPLVVPTTLRLASMNAYQNQNCHFLVQDFDRQTRSNNSVAFGTLAVGNLTPPSGFGGITSLANPTNSSTETTLDVGFTPIVMQSTQAPHGAYQYQIFTATGASANACTAGTINATLPASNFTAAFPTVVKITGLSPNTTYRVCVKAVDSDGNLDVNNNQRTLATLVSTPPIFTGLQSAVYNIAAVKIDLTWNTAVATVLPVAGYFVRFRVGSGDLSANFTQVSVPASVCANGACAFSIIPANFPSSGLASGGVTAISVYACDTFNTVNTSQSANCSAITTANTKQVTVPNLTSPVNFYGIKTATATPNGGSRQNGVVQLTWSMNGCAPAACVWTSDFAGFRIYDLNGGMDPINVNCLPNAQGIADCSVNPVYQYTLTGLVPGKPYNFFVTAVNANFIETTTSHTTAISISGTDTVAPAFPSSPATSHIAATFNQSSRTISLSWDNATDNQYTGAVSYNIFQLVTAGTSCSGAGITSAQLTTPVVATATSLNGTVTAAQTILASNGGQLYAYRVEASDGQSNVRQGSDLVCLYIPDLVPPAFTAKPSAGLSYQAGNAKNWAISWTATDNRTSSAQLNTRVYLAISSSGTPPTPAPSLFATGSDLQYVAPNQLQSDGNRSSQLSAAGANRYPDATHYAKRDANDYSTDKWYHYIVIVTDSDGNYVYDTVSLFSPGFNVTGITRARGTIGGGKVLVVEGSGLTNTTQIWIDSPSLNQACTPLGNSDNYFELSGRMTDPDPSRIRQFVACTTPPHASGAVTIYATDSGLSAASQTPYTYYDPAADASPNLCDTAYGTQTSGSLSGSGGSQVSPAVVCNVWQLANVPNNCGYNPKYVSIQDNIYFGTAYWTPLKEMNGIDAQNNFLIGMRPSSANAALIGGYIDDNCNGHVAISYSNLNMVRVQFLQAAIGNTYADAAAVIANTGDISNQFTNVHVQVLDTDRTTKANRIAGMVGRGRASFTNSTSLLILGAPGGATDSGGFVGSFFDNFNPTVVGSVATVKNTGVQPDGLGGFVNYVAGNVNLSISNSNVYVNSGASYLAGGVIGYSSDGASSNLQSVLVSGSVSASSNMAGGVVGRSGGAFNLNNVQVKANLSGNGAGGLVGLLYSGGNSADPASSIVNSTYSGQITSTGAPTGGLIGSLYYVGDAPSLALTNSSVTAGTTLNGTDNVGGLIGDITLNVAPAVQVSQCQFEGTINGASSVGGLIGRANRLDNTNLGGQIVTVSESLSKGTINGVANVGGLIGSVYNLENTNAADAPFLRFQDSYVVGSVSGSSNVGGLAGAFVGQGSKAPFYFANFTNNFARVAFPGSVGGTTGWLFGYLGSSKADGQASGVYYDAGYAPASSPTNAIGSGTLTGLAGAGLTSARFVTSGNLSGWNFSSTWHFTNGVYPTLVNNPE